MFGKKKKKVLISQPTNFEHRVHTGYDKKEGKFIGLPPQWASIVGNNQILKSTNRPLPLVDPSEITHTEILDLKVSLRIWNLRCKWFLFMHMSTCQHIKMLCLIDHSSWGWWPTYRSVSWRHSKNIKRGTIKFPSYLYTSTTPKKFPNTSISTRRRSPSFAERQRLFSTTCFSQSH